MKNWPGQAFAGSLEVEADVGGGVGEVDGDAQLGDRVRAIRTARGLSQERLALASRIIRVYMG